MICPLCGQRKARRTCPALGQTICAVCCGTKRLVQIQCPPDCAYLAVAREHPPATVVRRQQQDLGLIVPHMRDLNTRQSQLFFLVCSFLGSYTSAGLQPLIDDDVAEAGAALAATLETSARGVIYEHRPASLPAERLVASLKPLLAEAGGPADRRSIATRRSCCGASRTPRAACAWPTKATAARFSISSRASCGRAHRQSTATSRRTDEPRVILP